MITSVLSWVWIGSGVLLIISVLLHSPKGDGMGGLADIAPTLLEILGLPQPARMTGHSLIVPLGSPAVPNRIPQTLGV